MKNLRAGSVDGGVVGLCIGRRAGGSLGLLGTTKLSGGNETVGAENTECHVFVKNLLAYMIRIRIAHQVVCGIKDERKGSEHVRQRHS